MMVILGIRVCAPHDDDRRTSATRALTACRTRRPFKPVTVARIGHRLRAWGILTCASASVSIETVSIVN